MKKIYMKADIVENIIDTQKGTLDANMKLKLINGKEYKLKIAVKILDNNHSDLPKLILTIDQLKIRNYELYSALSFSRGKPLLRKNNLFDDEVEANGKTYKVDVGYIGSLCSEDNCDDIKTMDLISIIKQEHIVIRKMLNSLSQQIKNGKTNLVQVSTKLNSLFDYINAHVEKEDLFLYPDYFSSEKLETVNKKEQGKMKVTHNKFLSYYDKWEDKINLKNFKEFRKETDDIIKILNLRMDIEDNEILIHY